MVKLDLNRSFKVIFILSTISLLASVQSSNAYLLPGSYMGLDGTPVSYDTYEGKYLLIEAFSTKCGACISYHPELAKVYDALSSQINMVSVSINAEDTIPVLNQFISEHPTSWDIGMDIDRYLVNTYGITHTPTTILLNEEGRRMDMSVGSKTASEVIGVVEGYLALTDPDNTNSPGGFDDNDGSGGSLIEDLFGSTLFRISFLGILVIMLYIKMTGGKAVA